MYVASQLVGEQPDEGGGLGLGLQSLLRRQSSRYDESVHGRRVVEMTLTLTLTLAPTPTLTLSLTRCTGGA